MANLYCIGQTREDLRFAVFHKYKKIYGVLKHEVDIALRERSEKLMEEYKRNNAKVKHAA